MKVVFTKLGEGASDTVVGKTYEVVSFSVVNGVVSAIYIDSAGEDNYHMEEKDCTFSIIEE